MRRVARLPLEELQPYLLETPPASSEQQADRGTEGTPAPSRLSWPAIFGNDNPVEIEIGFGKGLFLLTAGLQCPQVNFVGIEIERKYVLFTATRLAKRGLANVRLVCGDARLFLRERVPPGSFQAMHVYFPDPWWKTRHHKRRLFTDEFARLGEQSLRPMGCLHVVTDVADYIKIIQEVVARETRLTPLPPPEVNAPEHDLDYLTNFDRKYRRAGKPIYRAIYQR